MSRFDDEFDAWLSSAGATDGDFGDELDRLVAEFSRVDSPDRVFAAAMTAAATPMPLPPALQPVALQPRSVDYAEGSADIEFMNAILAADRKAFAATQMQRSRGQEHAQAQVATLAPAVSASRAKVSAQTITVRGLGHTRRITAAEMAERKKRKQALIKQKNAELKAEKAKKQADDTLARAERAAARHQKRTVVPAFVESSDGFVSLYEVRLPVPAPMVAPPNMSVKHSMAANRNRIAPPPSPEASSKKKDAEQLRRDDRRDGPARRTRQRTVRRQSVVI